MIDFKSLAHSKQIKKETADDICGGRHRMLLEKWTDLMKGFEKIGCNLVFFCDLKVPQEKISELKCRIDDNFAKYERLYNEIDQGKNDLEMIAKKNPKIGISSINYGLAAIAQSYGDFHFSTENEGDLEIAHYATKHNALAILSSDTDFLIFSGKWRLWSAHDVEVVEKTQLKTTEINRMELKSILSLSSEQLPLFATLCGNDITQPLHTELYKYFARKKWGKFKAVASFVREMAPDYDIIQIVSKVFRSPDNRKAELIESSVNSYNTDVEISTITSDPIALQLFKSKVFRFYMGNMKRIQNVNTPLYDFRGCEHENTLPDLIIDWIKRRRGILTIGRFETQEDFTVVVRRGFNVPCKDNPETPTHPDCKLTSHLSQIN